MGPPCCAARWSRSSHTAPADSASTWSWITLNCLIVLSLVVSCLTGECHQIRVLPYQPTALLRDVFNKSLLVTGSSEANCTPLYLSRPWKGRTANNAHFLGMYNGNGPLRLDLVTSRQASHMLHMLQLTNTSSYSGPGQLLRLQHAKSLSLSGVIY